MPLRKQKLVTVLCCFNQGHLLPRQLAAIARQDYRPLEVILVDDGSTDNTFEVMSEFCASTSFARVIRNERNIGLIPSFNRATLEADGDFIYGAASDDEVQPGLFSALMNCAAEFPEAGVVFCDPIWEISGHSVARPYGLSDQVTFLPPDAVADLYRTDRLKVIAGHTLAWNLPKYKSVGMLRPELGGICDFFPTWALAFRFGAAYVPKALALATVHSNQWSRRQHRQRTEALRAHRAMVETILSSEFADIRERFIASRVLARFPLMLNPLIATGQLFSLLSTQDALRLVALRGLDQVKHGIRALMDYRSSGAIERI